MIIFVKRFTQTDPRTKSATNQKESWNWTPPPESAAPSTGPRVNDYKYLFCDLVLDSEHHKGCP